MDIGDRADRLDLPGRSRNAVRASHRGNRRGGVWVAGLIALMVASPALTQSGVEEPGDAPAADGDNAASVDSQGDDAANAAGMPLRFGVGTGPVLGTYYPIGGALAGLIDTV